MASGIHVISRFFLGGLPDKVDYEVRRKVSVLNAITTIGIFFALLYGLIAAFRGEQLLSIILFLQTIFFIASLVYLRITKDYAVAIIIVSVSFMFLLLYLLVTGGSNNTGPLWYYIFPLAVIFLNGLKKGLILLSVLLLVSVIVLFVPYFPILFTGYSLEFKTRFLSTLLVVSLVSYFYEYHRYTIQQKMSSASNDMQETVNKLKNTQAQLVQSEKLASMGQLAAGVAHEINNPVGFVSSNSVTLVAYIQKMKEIIELIHTNAPHEEVIQREKELKMDIILDDIDDLINENIEGLTRITDIVQNLKDFARAGTKEEYVEANINDGLNNTLLIAKNEIKYHADVKKEFGDISTIECDLGGINQVFLNILVNAAQAIKSQQRKESGRITIKTYEDRDSVFCEIADDGPGIPKETILNIFDPFYTTKEAGDGTGLGLSISYDIIVNKHNGSIDVQSENGKGTTFIIKLPKTQGASDE